MRALRLAYVGPAASVHVQRWIQWFVAHGHDCHVLTVEPADKPPCHQVDLSAPRPAGKLGRVLSAIRMRLVLERLQPDVVHVHYARGLAWGLTVASCRPLVASVWGSDVLEDQGAFRDWGRFLTPRLLRAADLITVHSGFLEAHVRGLLPDAKTVQRIGWGVDLQAFRPGIITRPLRTRLGLREDQRVVFSPRIAKPFYRHEWVLHAMPAVYRTAPDAVLIIPEQHADDRYVAALRDEAASLGIADRVRFVPAIPYEEMPLWFNLADAVVMVPPSDGMPNTLLEAMACGCVPIVSALPQYADAIRDGLNGVSVEHEREIGPAIVRALSDAGWRADAARRNREWVCAAADQDREMAEMERWYHMLAAAPHRRGLATQET